VDFFETLIEFLLIRSVIDTVDAQDDLTWKNLFITILILLTIIGLVWALLYFLM
jgi:hypothetical protein